MGWHQLTVPRLKDLPARASCLPVPSGPATGLIRRVSGIWFVHRTRLVRCTLFTLFEGARRCLCPNNLRSGLTQG